MLANEPNVLLNLPNHFDEIPKEVFQQAGIYQLQFKRMLNARNDIWWPIARRCRSQAPAQNCIAEGAACGLLPNASNVKART
jgi:hypothetical protein